MARSTAAQSELVTVRLTGDDITTAKELAMIADVTGSNFSREVRAGLQMRLDQIRQDPADRAAIIAGVVEQHRVAEEFLGEEIHIPRS